MNLEKLLNLKEFLQNEYGSTWHKVNLHVHALGQDPEKLVDQAIKAGITLIAITDHNTFRFVKPVQIAAKKRSDTNLVVLPGIEITLEEGAHILAIFDSGFDEDKQTHFLGTIKLPINGSDATPVRERTCTQVLTDITDAKGITVVPHPYSEDIGFLDRARKLPTKMAWLESGNIGLIQIPQEKVKYIDYDVDGKWQNRYILASTPPAKIPSTDYSLSPIPSGEAKTPEDIENGATWLKVGSRTIRGLRQVTCEPGTCISKTKPPAQGTSRLLGLTIKGGFFDGLRIGFSSAFTCIFGENHSGKTAIFDFISFALGRDLVVLGVGREEELELLLRRLDAILQPSGEVNLYLMRNGQGFCLSRKFTPKYDKNTKIVGVQDNPEALRYDPPTDGLVPVNIEEAIFMPEIYSQGHVGVLRKSVQSQLSLIDELAGLSGDRKKRDEIKQKLTENADALAGLFDKREKLAGSVGTLPDLKKQLAENRRHLEETDNDLWESSKAVIEESNSRITTLGEYLSDEEIIKKELLISISKYENDKVILADLLKGISDSIDKYNSAIQSATGQITQAYSVLRAAFMPLLGKWAEEFKTHKSQVALLLRKKGFESPDALLHSIESLQKQIKAIEQKLGPELEYTNGLIKDLRKEREKYKKEFDEACGLILRARQSKIEELNRYIGPDIKIALEKPDLGAYLELLIDIYTDISAQDRKLQKRDEQLSLIANKISPAELYEAINNDGKFRKGDGALTTLVEACGITYNTQQVLCSIRRAIKTFNKLETFEAEPEPKISVRREGTAKFADLRTELSPGEQSSSILALALTARDVPLLVDQPEDELGYAYIVNRIVPKILESKKKRQIILISHNANVPVLADAEFLIKIKNNPVESQSRCTVELSGTFADENVCNKILELEGGERAFQIRQYRYAIPRRVDMA